MERLDAAESALVAWCQLQSREQLQVGLLACLSVGDRGSPSFESTSRSHFVNGRAEKLEEALAFLRAKVPPFIPDEG